MEDTYEQAARTGPTVHDIAKRAGVSISTVSRALNSSGPVNPALKQRIMEIAEEFGYRPRAAARILRTKQTGIVVFGVTAIGNAFFTDIIPMVQDHIAEHGYDLLVYETRRERAKEERLFQMAEEHRADGFILLPECTAGSEFERLHRIGVPFVLFDARENPYADVVRSDDQLGIILAVRHLVECGHRRIAFVGNRQNAWNDRLAGYYQSLENLTGLHDSDLVLETQALEQIAPERVSQFIETRKPTAFVCITDMVAVRLMSVLIQLGYRVPDDYSVVGFDDCYLASVVNPRLTTVNLNMPVLAKTACDLLLRRMQNPDPRDRGFERVVVPASLVVRDSVRRIT